ncbi:hypothetical protein GGR56DRAFT_147816 [Xylariaceae sp. FL0804]|nr:hypothetical protein GGR56DRAFT_147816 [Xylariaceae sp. FL0804]
MSLITGQGDRQQKAGSSQLTKVPTGGGAACSAAWARLLGCGMGRAWGRGGSQLSGCQAEIRRDGAAAWDMPAESGSSRGHASEWRPVKPSRLDPSCRSRLRAPTNDQWRTAVNLDSLYAARLPGGRQPSTASGNMGSQSLIISRCYRHAINAFTACSTSPAASSMLGSCRATSTAPMSTRSSPSGRRHARLRGQRWTHLDDDIPQVQQQHCLPRNTLPVSQALKAGRIFMAQRRLGSDQFARPDRPEKPQLTHLLEATDDVAADTWSSPPFKGHFPAPQCAADGPANAYKRTPAGAWPVPSRAAGRRCRDYANEPAPSALRHATWRNMGSTGPGATG